MASLVSHGNTVAEVFFLNLIHQTEHCVTFAIATVNDELYSYDIVDIFCLYRRFSKCSDKGFYFIYI